MGVQGSVPAPGLQRSGPPVGVCQTAGLALSDRSLLRGGCSGLGTGWQFIGCSWDCGHRVEREHAAALQLPVLLLPQQHGHHQAGDRDVVAEDVHHPGAAFDHCTSVRTFRCDVQPLQQVCALYLVPLSEGQVAKRQHVLAG